MLTHTLMANSDRTEGLTDFYELPPFLLGSIRETGELWILSGGSRTSFFDDTRSFTCSEPSAHKAPSLQRHQKDPNPLTVRVHKSFLRTSGVRTDQGVDDRPVEFHDGALRNLLATILTSLAPNSGENYTLVCMIRMLCARLCELWADNSQRMPRRFEDWQLALLEDVLNKDGDQSVSVSRAAGLCRLSVCHFSRLFRATFGMPLHRYMVRERIRRAMTRLSSSPDSIVQIALDSGFADQSTFTRRFTAVAGMPPAIWRRRSAQVGTKPHLLPSASGIC